MKKQERLNAILSELGKAAGISLHNLALTFDVSDMTIRRDLDELRAKGYITIIQGVAILNKNQDGSEIIKDYSLPMERSQMSAEKLAIAKLASTLVEPDDTILIDTGTTTECLFSFIPKNFSLTIVCYNMNTLIESQKMERSKIIFPGGFYHPNTQMFESTEGAGLISRLCINKCFLSAAGISTNGAVSCIEQHELLYKQNAIKSSMTKILMADSTKFGKIRPCMFTNLSNIDIVITDDNLSKEWIQHFGNIGIQCMIAPTSSV